MIAVYSSLINRIFRIEANQRNTDNDDQAESNERHKQDQLKKQKEGKGHWKPELASNSEEAVSLVSCEAEYIC